MDIQLKKSGIGVKEKSQKSSVIFNKQNLFAYAMLIPTFVCMMCIHFIPMLQGIYMSLLDLNQLTMTKFLNAPFIGLKIIMNSF